MAKLDKFEDRLNSIVFSIGKLLKKLLFLIIPLKVRTKIGQGVSIGINKLENVKVYASVKVKSLPKKVLDQKETLNRYTKIVSDTSKKLIESSKKIKTKDFKPGNLLLALSAFLVPVGTKIKTWYFVMRPETVLTFCVTSTIAGLAGINIYKSSEEIMQKSKKVAEVAERVEEVEYGDTPSRRPAYYNAVRRQFLISHVSIPVYIESNSNIKSLIIDFTVQSSNRFIREFCLQNEHLVKDKLSNSLQPVIPTFPLTHEGKKIITEKIKEEMNKLLIELDIDGYIEEILINHIITA